MVFSATVSAWEGNPVLLSYCSTKTSIRLLSAADADSLLVKKSQNDYELMNQHVDVRVFLLEVRNYLSVLDQDDAHYVKVAITSSSTKTVH